MRRVTLFLSTVAEGGGLAPWGLGAHAQFDEANQPICERSGARRPLLVVD